MSNITPAKMIGTKILKQRFSLSDSMQLVLRKKGMPFYRLPSTAKILYDELEVTAWLTSQKGASSDV